MYVHAQKKRPYAEATRPEQPQTVKLQHIQQTGENNPTAPILSKILDAVNEIKGTQKALENRIRVVEKQKETQPQPRLADEAKRRRKIRQQDDEMEIVEEQKAVCRRAETGKCRFGSKCWYQHPTCTEYSLGRCTYGSKCWNSHPKDSTREGNNSIMQNDKRKRDQITTTKGNRKQVISNNNNKDEETAFLVEHLKQLLMTKQS